MGCRGEKVDGPPEDLPLDYTFFSLYATPWQQLKMLFGWQRDEEKQLFWGPQLVEKKPTTASGERTKPLEVRYYQEFGVNPTQGHKSDA